MLCVCITLHKLYKQLRLLQLLLPDCIYFSCCSLITFTSAAACSLCSLQLLHPDCTHLNCWSPIASLFSCYSLIGSASAAAPWLRPLLLLNLPNCLHFGFSPIASTSAVPPQLCLLGLLLLDCVSFSCCSLIEWTLVAPRLHPLVDTCMQYKVK